MQVKIKKIKGDKNEVAKMFGIINTHYIFTIMTVIFIISTIYCILRIYSHRESIAEMKKTKIQYDMYIVLFEGLIIIFNNCVLYNAIYVKLTTIFFLIYLNIVKIILGSKKIFYLLIPFILLICFL